MKIQDYSDVPLRTSKEDIIKKVRTVKTAYHNRLTLSLDFRLDQLRNLFYAIKDNEDVLREAVEKDFHRSCHETQNLELNTALGEIDLAIHELPNWIKDEKAPFPGLTFATASPTVKHTPLGTVLMISPWNYPFFLSLIPLASIIAAGNTVVWKPTEVIPNTTRALTKLIEKHLDPSLIQIVNGEVEETTTLLEQQFDKILFTGSGRIGKIVASAASKHLTPTILELGGKSPALVGASADIKTSAKRIAWGKFTNAGQTCVAPDYVLVDSTVHDQFVAELKKVIREFFPVSGPANEDLAHIPSDRLWNRLNDLLKRTKGTIVEGGDTEQSTRYVAPTIVTNVKPDDALMEDELFAPILPIIPVDNIATTGVEYVIHHHDTPLALYAFTKNSQEADTILEHTRSGGAIVNDTLLHVGCKTVPFGGIGQSGYGAYHGKYGFEAFSHKRAVLRQPFWVEFLLKMRYPPYSNAKTARMGRLGTVTPFYGRSGPVRKSLIRRILGSKLFWLVLLFAVGQRFVSVDLRLALKQ